MKGYLERAIHEKIIESLESNLVTMIIGPRQVGKSTLMNMAQEFVKKEKQVDAKDDGTFQVSQNSFFYVLDDIQLRGYLKKDIRYIQKDVELSLGNSLEKSSKKVFIFIDEVQKMPQLFDWVKQIFDQNSNNIKFILTGSSSIGITNMAAETLAGRVEHITVYPFVYSELLAAKTSQKINFFGDLFEHIDEHFDSTVTGDDAILAQLQGKPKTDTFEKFVAFLNEYFPQKHSALKMVAKEATATVVENLFYGGLPRIITSPIEDRMKMIKSYISVYLEKEIGAVARNLDLELFGLSLQSFAQQNGETLNINQVSKEVGISRPSLYKYLDLLENTYLIKKVYPYLRKGEAQEETTKSIMLYYLDTGVLNNLSYVTSIQEMIRPDTFSKIIGSWLLGTLLAYFSSLDSVPQVYYWQDYAGHRVDLVFERGDYVFGTIINKPKDPRRLRATIDKFVETANRDNVVILFPTFDAVSMSLEYKVTPIEHPTKKVISIEVPLQFLG
ncbi:MAG: AAA family ATPase [Candidatus Dojkabacteria bacterium]|nr:MAG: AAA family ATPase [Candidatus Dojkabacteria bacterium]